VSRSWCFVVVNCGCSRAKCCAPQLPRQFGEGEHVVFAGNIIPKTLALCLKRSTKCRRRCRNQRNASSSSLGSLLSAMYPPLGYLGLLHDASHLHQREGGTLR
jgi:hypothetical protein